MSAAVPGAAGTVVVMVDNGSWAAVAQFLNSRRRMRKLDPWSADLVSRLGELGLLEDVADFDHILETAYNSQRFQEWVRENYDSSEVCRVSAAVQADIIDEVVTASELLDGQDELHVWLGNLLMERFQSRGPADCAVAAEQAVDWWAKRA